MASSIISTTIDETYPVAGQDNDSQGFRDNFTIIKDNFAFAKTEIETLQTDAAKLNVSNAFSYNTQSQTVTKEVTKTRVDSTVAASGTSNIQFSNSNWVEVNVQGTDGTINIQGWPEVTESAAYGEIVFALSPNTSPSSYVVKFTSENASGTASQVLIDDSTQFTSVDANTASIAISTSASTQYKLVKAMTWDRGGRLFLQYLGEFTETS